MFGVALLVLLVSFVSQQVHFQANVVTQSNDYRAILLQIAGGPLTLKMREQSFIGLSRRRLCELQSLGGPVARPQKSQNVVESLWNKRAPMMKALPFKAGQPSQAHNSKRSRKRGARLQEAKVLEG
jgi:hypothetical protein